MSARNSERSWVVKAVVVAALIGAAVVGVSQRRPAAAATLAATAPGVPANRDAELGTAKATVTAYFAAVESRNCAEVTRLRARVSENDCAPLFHEVEHHDEHFKGIVGAQPDGRDAHAYLVTTRVSLGARETQAVLRVIEGHGTWKVSN